VTVRIAAAARYVSLERNLVDHPDDLGYFVAPCIDLTDGGEMRPRGDQCRQRFVRFAACSTSAAEQTIGFTPSVQFLISLFATPFKGGYRSYRGECGD